MREKEILRQIREGVAKLRQSFTGRETEIEGSALEVTYAMLSDIFKVIKARSDVWDEFVSQMGESVESEPAADLPALGLDLHDDIEMLSAEDVEERRLARERRDKERWS